jgi:hypothetical protein
MPRNQTSYWAGKPAYLFSCWTWIFGDIDWLAHSIIHGLLEWYWPSAHKLGCHSQCAFSDWRLKFTNFMPTPIMRITRIFSKKHIKCCFLIFSVCCPLLCAAYTLSSVTSYFGNRNNLWSAEYFAFKWKIFWPAIGKWTCLYPLGYQLRINPILLLVPSTHWSSPYTGILEWRIVCTQICPKTQGGWSEFCETFDCTILHLVSTSDIYLSG